MSFSQRKGDCLGVEGIKKGRIVYMLLGSFPQAKHQLQIRVEKILELAPGPHSDE